MLRHSLKLVGYLLSVFITFRFSFSSWTSLIFCMYKCYVTEKKEHLNTSKKRLKQTKNIEMHRILMSRLFLTYNKILVEKNASEHFSLYQIRSLYLSIFGRIPVSGLFYYLITGHPARYIRCKWWAPGRSSGAVQCCSSSRSL